MMMMMAPKVQAKILPKLLVVLSLLAFCHVEAHETVQLTGGMCSFNAPHTLTQQGCCDSGQIRQLIESLKSRVNALESGKPDKWRLVFKAVAGAGGDIYQLWTSNQALNADNPKAKQLNDDLLAHYKSSAVNNWASQKIKYVKVVLYQAGIERLVLVFNAVGSDKMSWFTRGRLISSPYVDIKTASTSTAGYFFSIQGHTKSIHQRNFYINKSYNGCDDDVGWLTVVNRAYCSYETVPRYPAFIYAPGHTAIRFAKGTQAYADVFAIFTATK